MVQLSCPMYRSNEHFAEHVVVTYACYACVADCADAMADAWEDTAGCAQPICLHENLLRDSIPLCGDCTGSCTHERGLCSEYAHEYGYSQCASLCNYSFLVRLHVSSKSPELYVVEVYADYPIRYDRTDILPACTRYQRSAHGQRSKFTTAWSCVDERLRGPTWQSAEAPGTPG